MLPIGTRCSIDCNVSIIDRYDALLWCLRIQQSTGCSRWPLGRSNQTSAWHQPAQLDGLQPARR